MMNAQQEQESETDAKRPSYLELRNQGLALMAQAEEARQREIEGVIKQIRNLATTYGLGAEDIFGGRRARVGAKSPEAVTGGYRCPSTGVVWSGRGRRPQWIAKAIEAGTDIAQYKID